MLGHATLYVPGTDHAGIATQSVVEKKLKKDHNVTRHDLGRDEFVKVWRRCCLCSVRSSSRTACCSRSPLLRSSRKAKMSPGTT